MDSGRRASSSLPAKSVAVLVAASAAVSEYAPCHSLTAKVELRWLAVSTRECGNATDEERGPARASADAGEVRIGLSRNNRVQRLAGVLTATATATAANSCGRAATATTSGTEYFYLYGVRLAVVQVGGRPPEVISAKGTASLGEFRIRSGKVYE